MKTKARKVALIVNGLVDQILDYPEAPAPVNNPEIGMFDITYAEPALNVGDAFVIDPEDVNAGVIPEPYTVISTGSMNKRLTMTEEIALEDSNDTTIKILMRRLFNSDYADLENQELKDGITAVTNYLATVDKPGSDPVVKIVADPAARYAELMVWGTEDESYKGIL